MDLKLAVVIIRKVDKKVGSNNVFCLYPSEH